MHVLEMAHLNHSKVVLKHRVMLARWIMSLC
jgi:hypothetical protein